MYLGLALPYLLNPFYQTQHLDIYWSSFLVCTFTMVLVSVLSAVSVRRMDAELSWPNNPSVRRSGIRSR